MLSKILLCLKQAIQGISEKAVSYVIFLYIEFYLRIIFTQNKEWLVHFSIWEKRGGENVRGKGSAGLVVQVNWTSSNFFHTAISF